MYAPFILMQTDMNMESPFPFNEPSAHMGSMPYATFVPKQETQQVMQPTLVRPHLMPYLSQRSQLMQPAQPPSINIRGINALMVSIGYPDIVDSSRGGIAIWSSDTLKSLPG